MNDSFKEKAFSGRTVFIFIAIAIAISIVVLTSSVYFIDSCEKSFKGIWKNSDCLRISLIDKSIKHFPPLKLQKTFIEIDISYQMILQRSESIALEEPFNLINYCILLDEIRLISLQAICKLNSISSELE